MPALPPPLPRDASQPPPVPAAAAQALPALGLPYPSGWWRAACFILAFFQPWLGLALALLYWQGPDRRSRRFSRWCLVLAALGFFLSSMGGALWTGLENGERSIQPW